MMGIKHLQSFVTVVEKKNFTRAAEMLYLTQSALSKQIKVLESYLGAELLKRYDKEVVLTDAGAVFYPEAKKILSIFYSASEGIKELQGLVRGKLVLGASSLPGDYILPNVIGRFRQIYPGLEVQLKISDTSRTIAAVKSGVVEIGFLGAVPEDFSLIVEPYLEDELILIVPPGWSAVNSWGELDMNNLILRERGSGTRQIVEESLQKVNIGFDGKVKTELGSTQAIINAVAAGWGFSFVSRYAAEEVITAGKVRKVANCGTQIKRSIVMVILKGHTLSYAGRAFWDCIKKHNEGD